MTSCLQLDVANKVKRNMLNKHLSPKTRKVTWELIRLNVFFFFGKSFGNCGLDFFFFFFGHSGLDFEDYEVFKKINIIAFSVLFKISVFLKTKSK